MTFDSIVTDKGFTYGGGAITDGTYKLSVCISQYTPNRDFIEGAHVRVRGVIKINKSSMSC